jgi:hypothetical protein
VDRGYSSHRFRQQVREAGAKPEAWRAIAARDEKAAARCSGIPCLAAALDHLT